MDFLLLLAGLIALGFGAEALVRGSSRLAAALGVRPLVIGLIVVGFGTSMPEFVVSGMASFAGRSETALGNVLGSNIANPGLILAAAALLRPMKCELMLLRREAPLLLLVTLGTWAVGWTGSFTRFDGVVLLAGLAVFVWFSLRWAKQESATIQAEFKKFETEQNLLQRGPMGAHLVWIAVGIVLLVAGGHLLVEAATAIARQFGVPEIVIAATLVAVGTSVPELATSLIAAARGEADISVGNVIGSNLFNLLGVLGLSAAIRPIPVSRAALTNEFAWMFGFTVATIVVLRTGNRITRVEGGLLLAGYIVFTVLLFR